MIVWLINLNVSGNTPIRQGFRVQLYNDAVIRQDTAKSGFVPAGGQYYSSVLLVAAIY